MKSLKLFAKGFNYSQDGPGNRLVYHLCGCNMHCPWCANPEGMEYHREDKTTRIISSEEILEEILSCEPMFYDDGGVTFTGGEATLRMDALLELMPVLQEKNIGVVVETNATHPELAELFPYLQLLIADLKHPDSSRLADVTGITGENVYRNLRKASEAGVPMLIRIPVIHGFNDSTEVIAAFAAFLKELNIHRKGTLRVELLPYHEYGRDKWNKLGLPYTVTDGFVSAERIRFFEESLRENGISVIHT